MALIQITTVNCMRLAQTEACVEPANLRVGGMGDLDFIKWDVNVEANDLGAPLNTDHTDLLSFVAKLTATNSALIQCAHITDHESIATYCRLSAAAKLHAKSKVQRASIDGL